MPASEAGVEVGDLRDRTAAEWVADGRRGLSSLREVLLHAGSAEVDCEGVIARDRDRRGRPADHSHTSIRWQVLQRDRASPQYLPADANCTVTDPAGLGCPRTSGSGSPAKRSREYSSRIMASAASGRFRSGTANASMTKGCTPGAAVPSSTTTSSRTSDPSRDHE